MLRKRPGFVCDRGRCVVLTLAVTIRSNARNGLGAALTASEVAPLRAGAGAAGRGQPGGIADVPRAEQVCPVPRPRPPSGQVAERGAAGAPGEGAIRPP